MADAIPVHHSKLSKNPKKDSDKEASKETPQAKPTERRGKVTILPNGLKRVDY